MHMEKNETNNIVYPTSVYIRPKTKQIFIECPNCSTMFNVEEKDYRDRIIRCCPGCDIEIKINPFE